MALPLPYRVLFTIFDIVLPAWGIYGNIANSSAMLDMYVPTTRPKALFRVPIANETQFLLDSGAGWYAMLLFASIYLQLHSNQKGAVVGWTALQGGVLLTDVFMIFACYREMIATDGRFWVMERWVTMDWVNIGLTLAIGLVRASFLLGIGGALREDGARVEVKKRKAG